MTDMPSFGILCCGKDIKELSESVKCCGHITNIMKNGGYMLGGYHTAVTQRGDPASKKMCGEKLYHLCRSCDVLFTVGSDGFSPDDIIPDITMKLCESEAVFFTSNLCGASNIGNYDRGMGAKKDARRVFAPSRSRAGILCGCLVLNIRNDMNFIDATLPGLLPSISFAAACICGRSAEDSKNIKKSLDEFCDTGSRGGKTIKYDIFDKVQKNEINN